MMDCHFLHFKTLLDLGPLGYMLTVNFRKIVNTSPKIGRLLFSTECTIGMVQDDLK